MVFLRPHCLGKPRQIKFYKEAPRVANKKRGREKIIRSSCNKSGDSEEKRKSLGKV